ncbi:MAG: cellulase family glycosylhydrolase [Thermoleophilaceae bacterium]
MRKVRNAITGLLLLGATLGAAGTAHAAPGMEVALQDDAVFLYRSYYDRDAAFQQARALGVTRLRVNMLWDRALGAQARLARRPAQLQYNWGPYDSVVDAAAAYGIRVQLTVAGPAPAWATGNHVVGPTSPNAARYGGFMRDVATHFRGRVDRYSIWNEPNWRGWLNPQRKAPALYRNLYVAGYRAVKSADPAAQVLIGELAPLGRRGTAISPLAFVRGITRHGKLRADGFAHHPYSMKYGPSERPGSRDDVTLGSLPRLSGMLHRLAKSRRLSTPSGKPLPLYLTEWGYFARGPRTVPMQKRVAFVRKSFDIAQRTPGVRQLLQYLLVQPQHGVSWDTSIVSPGGVASPTFNAIWGWAQKRG